MEFFRNCKSVAGRLDDPPLGHVKGFKSIVEEHEELGVCGDTVFYLVEQEMDGIFCGASFNVSLLALM